MSKKAHTPGPWREGADGNTRVYGPDGMGEHSGIVADVFKGRANARLIAAAPDLLEALEQNVSAFMTLAGFGPEIKALIGDDGWSKIADAVQASRAALSKATGGE